MHNDPYQTAWVLAHDLAEALGHLDDGYFFSQVTIKALERKLRSELQDQCEDDQG